MRLQECKSTWKYNNTRIYKLINTHARTRVSVSFVCMLTTSEWKKFLLIWLQFFQVFLPPLSVPKSQSAFIEWQSTIHRYLPPPKMLGLESQEQPIKIEL